VFFVTDPVALLSILFFESYEWANKLESFVPANISGLVSFLSVGRKVLPIRVGLF
jgi:hypothetical protein